MGFLMYTAHVHNLISKKQECERKLLDITKQYDDFHAYAERVGNGSMTIGDLLSTPSSMMGRAMNFMAYAHNSAMQYATTYGPQYEQMYMQQTGGASDPQQAQMMHNYIMQQLYMQARQEVAEVEKRNLNEIEAQLKKQKEEAETDLAIVEKELETYKKQQRDSIKDVIPEFA